MFLLIVKIPDRQANFMFTLIVKIEDRRGPSWMYLQSRNVSDSSDHVVKSPTVWDAVFTPVVRIQDVGKL